MAPWEFFEPTAEEYYFGKDADTYSNADDSIDSEDSDPSFDVYDQYEEPHNGQPQNIDHVLRWRQLHVGEQCLEISSEGDVKNSPGSLFEGSTKGIHLAGTPYAVFAAADALLYVHDLVYVAFNGPPPSGWEVRHRKSQKRDMYCNALRHLTITPTLLIQRPNEQHHHTCDPNKPSGLHLTNSNAASTHA